MFAQCIVILVYYIIMERRKKKTEKNSITRVFCNRVRLYTTRKTHKFYKIIIIYLRILHCSRYRFTIYIYIRTYYYN